MNEARKLLAQVYRHKKVKTICPGHIVERNVVGRDVVRKFAIGTGLACHLVGKQCPSIREGAGVTHPIKHVALHTANGLTAFDKELGLGVDQSGLNGQTLVLGNSPDVLSLGQLVVDGGFGLRWDPFKRYATIARPGGVEIELDVGTYVPALTDHTSDSQAHHINRPSS